MDRLRLLACVVVVAAGCGGGGGGPGAPDVPPDGPADTLPDLVPDGPAEAGDDVAGDLPADLPPDVADDLPADPGTDAPEDVPLDLPADVPADGDTGGPDAPALALFHAFESPVALTPDGRTALLWTFVDGRFAFLDTATGQVAEKGVVGNPQRNVPTALSGAGHVTALHGEPVQAGLWSEAGGWRDLGSPLAEGCINDPGPPVMGDLSSAWDVSADGRVVVGMAWDGCTATRAFRWTDTGGTGTFRLLDRLGKVAGGSGQTAPYNRATVVSADGRVAAGFAQNGSADRSPAIWAEDGAGFLIEPANDTEPGEVKAISADGSRVAGDWNGGGFTWTAAGGVVRFTASDSPFDTVVLNAMTDDGGQVYGTVVTFDPELLATTQKAFVRTAAGGVRTLDEVAAAAGVAPPQGVRFTNVLSVSADGTVVLGTVEIAPADPGGFPAQATFVLRLPLTPR